jgi:hypothetical protein
MIGFDFFYRSLIVAMVIMMVFVLFTEYCHILWLLLSFILPIFYCYLKDFVTFIFYLLLISFPHIKYIYWRGGRPLSKHAFIFVCLKAVDHLLEISRLFCHPKQLMRWSNHYELIIVFWLFLLYLTAWLIIGHLL